MSVELHPGIEGLDPSSLKYSIYKDLYNSFFNSQDKKSETNPYGISEGDDTSIRLHNTAYNFADAIAGGVVGDGNGNEGGVLLDYIKKSGGDMYGMLRANCGFEAGIHNNRLLHTFYREDNAVYGVKIEGNLELGNRGLYIGNKQLLGYDPELGSAILNGDIYFKGSSVKASGVITVGNDAITGVTISSEEIKVQDHIVYHGGNSNLPDVDWSMRDSSVSGNLVIGGEALFSGKLRACNGVELGFDNHTFLSIDSDYIHANSYLSFGKDYGIMLNNIPVLKVINENDIQIGGAKGELIIGNDTTVKARLLTGITDISGEYQLISPYGTGYFPEGLTIRHNYGDFILSSYRKDSADEGVVILKRLRFGDSEGAYLSGIKNEIILTGGVNYINPDTGTNKKIDYQTVFSYGVSSSSHQPLNRETGTLYISTEADFITFDKGVESKTHLGIDNSFTRLVDEGLFLSNNNYLISISDGIQHYGNAYFNSDLSSLRFSSGFAGSGWSIFQNKTTGNISATFDELTIRKKMRIYELEVQKNSVTNGALWVSDSCSGDTVIKL